MKTVFSENAPKALGPYSQAMVTGNLLFISGQGGIDPATGKLVEGIEAQTKQAIANIKAILTEAGIGFENVVKTTCFLHEMSDFAAFNAIYGEAFISKPARSCVAVKELPANFLCEIEVIAEI
ncbi:Rid family detoxifying hydrolase [uncultured Veillonella sp.]|uniref:Rid family detoxifying hydrolase n=1 Tax=uncultured Veillonella sp. TaxID=159268 RepID=UPI0025D2A800|nr:Rid family detoxifying hydrolase [uncultured Veillonella sp.]MDY3974222.1 Rid family detoxifying hydrolase [Veillonella caviae]